MFAKMQISVYVNWCARCSREKEQHERHMRQMEDEMELQVTRVEERVKRAVSIPVAHTDTNTIPYQHR